MKKHWLERFFEFPSILLDKFINIFMEENIFTGALPDPRPVSEQEKNWTHEEVFGMGGYEWKEIPESLWPVYPIRNQNGSGKCGPFGGTFALGRNNEGETGKFVMLDTDYVYQLRANNGPGMWFDDLLKLLCTHGAPIDPNLLSENNTDADSAKRKFTQEQRLEALKYRGSSFLFINPKNIDGIAQAIAMGYTPIYLLRCNIKEWTAEPFVDPAMGSEAFWNINHFVPTYLATLWKGKKSTVVNDSWGSSYGRNGRRILNEDFLNDRVFAVGYVIDLASKEIDKPVFKYTDPIEYGATGPEVAAWQKVLQYEKLLPTHTMSGAALPLGLFAAMTAQATRKWQVAHGIMDFADEKDIKKIRVGKKSIALAVNIYK